GKSNDFWAKHEKRRTSCTSISKQSPERVRSWKSYIILPTFQPLRFKMDSLDHVFFATMNRRASMRLISRLGPRNSGPLGHSRRNTRPPGLEFRKLVTTSRGKGLMSWPDLAGLNERRIGADL